MHAKGLLWHVTLRVQVAVPGPATGDRIDQLDTADLNDPMTFLGIQACRFRIENDLTQRLW